METVIGLIALGMLFVCVVALFALSFKLKNYTHFPKSMGWIFVALLIYHLSNLIALKTQELLIVFVVGIGMPVFIAGNEFAHHAFERRTKEGRSPDIFDFDFSKYYKDIRTSDNVINSLEWRIMNSPKPENLRLNYRKLYYDMEFFFIMAILGSLALPVGVIYFTIQHNIAGLVVSLIVFLALGKVSSMFYDKREKYGYKLRNKTYVMEG